MKRRRNNRRRKARAPGERCPQKPKRQRAKPYRETCSGCGNTLFEPGGFAGTGLCGPCCTGEADTIEP